MASILTETEIRAHLRADEDIPSTDIMPYFVAAEAKIQKDVGVQLSDLDGDDLEIAKEVVKMLGHQWYNNRSGNAKQEEPSFGIQNLISTLQVSVLPEVVEDV